MKAVPASLEGLMLPAKVILLSHTSLWLSSGSMGKRSSAQWSIVEGISNNQWIPGTGEWHHRFTEGGREGWLLMTPVAGRCSPSAWAAPRSWRELGSRHTRCGSGRNSPPGCVYFELICTSESPCKTKKTTKKQKEMAPTEPVSRAKAQLWHLRLVNAALIENNKRVTQRSG